jgi:hypothetical protein
VRTSPPYFLCQQHNFRFGVSAIFSRCAARGRMLTFFEITTGTRLETETPTANSHGSGSREQPARKAARGLLCMGDQMIWTVPSSASKAKINLVPDRARCSPR